jgi:hypothetical protein
MRTATSEARLRKVRYEGCSIGKDRKAAIGEEPHHRNLAHWSPGECILLRVLPPKMLSLKTPETPLLSRIERRKFIKTSSLPAGPLAFGVPALLRGQNLNSKLNIACIGIGGKGQSDTDACEGENIVALCDLDSGSEVTRLRRRNIRARSFTKISATCWTRWVTRSMR